MMGISSVWHWLILLIIIMLVFGTKKLRNIGHDLGGAIKGFKEGIREEAEVAGKEDGQHSPEQLQSQGQTIDVAAAREEKNKS